MGEGKLKNAGQGCVLAETQEKLFHFGKARSKRRVYWVPTPHMVLGEKREDEESWRLQSQNT